MQGNHPPPNPQPHPRRPQAPLPQPLKSRRRKNIPQIKIQLDDMLSQAFHEIHMQPKKNIRLGGSETYVLDNQLLRDYVQAVYEEYGIEDPLGARAEGGDGKGARGEGKGKEKDGIAGSKIRSSSGYGNGNGRGFETPEKQAVMAGQGTASSKKIQTEVKKGQKAVRTTERLSKLKQNFQSELQTLPTAIFQDDPRTAQKSNIPQTPHTVKQTPPSKRPQIKLSRRSSQTINLPLPPNPHPNPQAHTQQPRKPAPLAKHSHLLIKTQHKYCLMCEQPLQNDLINSHERQCLELQRLLNTPNLKLEQIQQILSTKIGQLERELQFYRNSMHEDINTMQELIDQVNREQYNGESDEEDEGRQGQQGQGQGLRAKFSMLSTVKCMEMLDKLRWFRKMRGKAEIKRGV